MNPLYRALTTSRLVVEVRRPGAGPQFMADLRAFDWLLQLAEFLTVFPQGCTSGMRAELCYCRMEEPPFAVG